MGAAVSRCSDDAMGAIAARCIDGQMADYGANNFGVLGHRRWLLTTIERVGIGFAHTGERGAGCIQVNSDRWDWRRPGDGWDSISIWPPPGVCPFELMSPTNFGEPESPNWHLEARGINFNNARVSLARVDIEAQQSIDVRFGLLEDFNQTKGVWIDVGAGLEPGGTYQVTVTATSGGTVEYRVHLPDCGYVVPEVCDPIGEDCRLPGLACYGLQDTRCRDIGDIEVGGVCVFNSDCVPGSTCVGWSMVPDRHCHRYCSGERRPDRPDAPLCDNICGPEGAWIFDDGRSLGVCRL